MSCSRREFLKRAGLAAAGLSGSRFVILGIADAEYLPGASGSKTKHRWALAIDTESCAAQGECSACIDACNQAHNIPHIADPKESIKWIWKERADRVFPHQLEAETPSALRKREIPVLCNHCENPPCVRVCPTQATWKRDDGIVMMDQHRCIGCRYCIVGCPYGARSFNFSDPRPAIEKIRSSYPTRTKGVVEKCTLCAERLANGNQPACVEACRSVCGAMLFGDLENPDSDISRLLQTTLTVRRKPELGTSPKVHYKL
jgi:molybdopterin-containing oxidoreductase family iron-sulfur binding subunit